MFKAAHKTELRQHTSSALTPSDRLGATLIEVLMCLMIIGIGVLSVFMLFPISVVNSIRATQLTSGAILKENASEIVHNLPQLLFPADGNASPLNFPSEWEPFKDYANGDLVIPRLKTGQMFPAPYYYLRCNRPGRSRETEPEWVSTITGYRGADADTTYAQPEPNWVVVDINHFVIDPTGYYSPATINPYRFGNRGGDTSFDAMLPRRSPTIANEFESRQLFYSPDSWSVVTQEIPQTISTDGLAITFSSATNFDGISTDPSITRVVLTSLDGRRSVKRYPDASTSGSVLRVTQPVPSDLVGPARLETYTPRYSYFYTLQSNGRNSPPLLSCAVVFNRASSSDSEFAYKANFGNVSFNADADVAGNAGSGPQPDQVKIYWGATDPEPLLKDGGYILDARAMVYYRITDFVKTANSATITLNRGVEFVTFNENGVGLAIIVPGILHVYEIQQ